MLPALVGCISLFALLAFGPAWPFAARLSLAPTEKLLASVVLSLIGVWLWTWIVYVGALPLAALWFLPALSAGGLLAGRPALFALGRDPSVRALLVAQLLVTAWCAGWLATVATYSGGGWAGDWFEHWERTRFFLERGPLDRVFLDQYSLTARPPLANVVTGALLHLTRADFATYQFVSTLLGSLAFLPAALLARRWGGDRAIAFLAVCFFLNPLFVQNATFAWTKLPAAFFVLGALYFFLRAHDPAPPPAAGVLCAAALGAALMVHYSAGPYAVALAGAWLALGWSRRRDAAWWRATAIAGAVGAVLLATWFGWAFAVYGAGATLLANTSVQAADATTGGQLARIVLNIRDTLVPHFLRPLDATLIAQTSPWGWWRDWFFQSYQANLILAFGSTAWLVLAVALRRTWSATARSVRHGWAGAVIATVLLGIAVHGARDTWGLTHICLQPVVLLGLAFLGGHARILPRPWRLVLVAGAAIDFALGLALHFGVQNLAFDRWFAPGRTPDAIFATYNQVAVMNVAAKTQHQLSFFADAIAPPLPVVAAWLAALLALALWRCRGRRLG